MPFRDDVTALAARQAALTSELATKAEELRETRALLADARARARLPVLDDIRVASPCDQRWDAMPGSERVRACGACQKQVFNLSAMTRDEAQELLARNTQGMCVRYYQRADGTIMTSDCGPGSLEARQRTWFAGVMATLFIGAGAAATMGADRGHWRFDDDGELTSYVDGQRTMMGAILATSPTPIVDPPVAVPDVAAHAEREPTVPATDPKP